MPWRAVRLVELPRLHSGPFGALLGAASGAEGLTIAPPGGAPHRSWVRTPLVGGRLWARVSWR
jgi:crotonobetainyl-CoA:carnitine CoA-transferase CaiB-like acyl-CoA transferase